MSMKITMKPLKGSSFEIDIAETASVSELKTKVAEAQPAFPVEQQKLILAGRILTDDLVLQDLGIKAGAFIVVMVAKPKPAPGIADVATAPAAADPAVTPPTAPDAMAQASATVAAGGASEAAIAQLCEMGFGRPEVERCLQAAFGNPDRAVEYLMGGIPDGALAPDVAPSAGAPMAQGTAAPPGTSPPAAGRAAAFPSMASAGGAPPTPVGDLPPALQELRNNPQFRQLAGMVAQNPEMLQQMLPVLAQSNPELLQAIGANPDAFGQMLREAAAGGGADQDPVEVMLAAAGVGGGRGQSVIQLTEEEMEAVGRLEALGFDRQMCAQAYIACDKNEELAANFLFDGAGDEPM